MGVFRLYNGDDGKSRIEDQSLASHPALTTPQTAVHIVFNQLPVGTFIDWHPAPRRQYIINLDGGVSIQASDGETRIIGAGEVLLVEDTSGKGHFSKAVEGKMRHSIFVPIE